MIRFGFPFRLLETVPTVPVPISVPGEPAPTVPVSGSGQVSRLFCNCDCEFLLRVKNHSDFWGPKVSPPPQKGSLAIFPCD